MKIAVDNLESPKTLTILGNESWLNSIYEQFHQQRGQILTGSITLTAHPYDQVEVKADISFSPILPCSRCAQNISWDLSRSFHITLVKSEEDQHGKHIELTSQDISRSFLDQDKSIDLVQLLLDNVISELPFQIVKRSEDGKSCQVCKKDISNKSVYTSPEVEDANPFEALKKLKFPD